MDDKKGRFNPVNMNELTRDAFRTLRQNISFSGGDTDVRTVVVTSAVPNEGKTSVSVGLGISMAESMKNTLIIECDCRRPSVGNRLRLRPKSNWIDVLYQHETLENAIASTDVPNLYFLDAEPGLVHSVELLSSGRFWDMVEQVKENFDFIIFDTPPLGSFIDAAVLSERADGAVLVVSSGSREIRLVKECIEQLKKANAKILGIVLNRVNAHRSSYYRYGDYYYRNQSKHSAATKATKEKAKASAKPPRDGAEKAGRKKADAAAGASARTAKVPVNEADIDYDGDEAIGWLPTEPPADAINDATYRPTQEDDDASRARRRG